MGPDPLDGVVPAQLLAQGCATDHQEAAEAEGGGDMGISFTGSSD